MLLKTIETMRITVVLIMGHDRLYSMLKNSNQDAKESQSDQTATFGWRCFERFFLCTSI